MTNSLGTQIQDASHRVKDFWTYFLGIDVEGLHDKSMGAGTFFHRIGHSGQYTNSLGTTATRWKEKVGTSPSANGDCAFLLQQTTKRREERAKFRCEIDAILVELEGRAIENT